MADRQHNSRRNVAVLGATGTIGTNAIDVIAQHPDRFSISLVTANSNAAELAAIAKTVGAARAVVADPKAYMDLKSGLAGSKIEAAAGSDAMMAALEPPIDLVVAGIVGTAGIPSAYRALERGMSLALANKECLVAAGDLFNKAVRDFGGEILTLDSEHSAIFQALGHSGGRDVETITITASGGPFRTWSTREMETVNAARAVQHPQWAMGPKISVDSATMMNKGLELIEAGVLFGDVCSQFDVVVHPQSIVHGYVTYKDGSVVAQMAAPDMRIPIAVALAWPDRIENKGPFLSLTECAQLTFEAPDRERFPALRLAENAMAAGQGATLVLNAANEIAVASFLDDQIGFLKIAEIVAETLEKYAHRVSALGLSSINDVLAFDHEARQTARDLISAL